MTDISQKDLLALLFRAYAEGYIDRSRHLTVAESDFHTLWAKSFTRQDFQNRSSSVTRRSGPTPEQLQEIKEAANKAREHVSKMSRGEKAELEAAARKRISEGRSNKAKAG